jgi:hypothetical protein
MTLPFEKEYTLLHYVKVAARAVACRGFAWAPHLILFD